MSVHSINTESSEAFIAMVFYGIDFLAYLVGDCAKVEACADGINLAQSD